MIIGIPKEIKNNEFRVGATPEGVYELVSNKHTVLVEKDAGSAIGFSDADYKKAGAKIIKTAKEIFKNADMILKVKEPQALELKMLRKDQILFTYLHLAANKKVTDGLIKSGSIAISYETVTDYQGKLPLLAPMSEIAGKLSIQVGAHHLEKSQGGRGQLLGGAPGVQSGKVVILGGGNVGENAARIAMGMGARTVLFDSWLPKLQQLDKQYGQKLLTLKTSKAAIIREIADADIVVGAALIPGDKAPSLITKSMLKKMQKGSVLVDVSIDQGGCFATSKPTTHSKPTYEIDGIIHYCVANMPGAVARTSTIALTNATLPFVSAIANQGWKKACKEDKHLKEGLNIIKGDVFYKAVADVFKIKYVHPDAHL